jgi:hypothetical protein
MSDLSYIPPPITIIPQEVNPALFCERQATQSGRDTPTVTTSSRYITVLITPYIDGADGRSRTGTGLQWTFDDDNGQSVRIIERVPYPEQAN